MKWYPGCVACGAADEVRSKYAADEGMDESFDGNLMEICQSGGDTNGKFDHGSFRFYPGRFDGLSVPPSWVRCRTQIVQVPTVPITRERSIFVSRLEPAVDRELMNVDLLSFSS
jgi:hypothetical protein